MIQARSTKRQRILDEMHITIIQYMCNDTLILFRKHSAGTVKHHSTRPEQMHSLLSHPFLVEGELHLLLTGNLHLLPRKDRSLSDPRAGRVQDDQVKGLWWK